MLTKAGVEAGAGAGPAQALSSRRTTPMFVRTLLWKNWVLKKRHPIATLLEIALPFLFVVMLSVLKNETGSVTVSAGWSDTAHDGTSYNLFQSNGSILSSPFTQPIPKFNTHETSLTGVLATLGVQSMNDGLKLYELSSSDLSACTLGVTVLGAVSTNSSSPYKIPDACAGKVVPYKIAIAPDTTFTREYFMQTMDLWYPRVALANGSAAPVIPSLRESVVFFDTADALTTYVESQGYGGDLNSPRVYAALVFDQSPAESDVGKFTSIEYTIRMNATQSFSVDTGVIPRTNGDPPAYSAFQKTIKVDYYASYAVNGFMAFQTLITRFVTCMPAWSAATKTTTGVCQNARSTASTSDELDSRLLETLNDDVRLRLALASYGSATTSVTSALASAPAATVSALLKPLRQAPQPYLGSAVAPFPIETYVSSSFYDSIKNVFAIVFVLAYLYCLSRMLVVFIQEKESRMREFMKILGVKEKAIVISWFITYGVVLFVGAIIQTLGGLLGVFANSSPVVMFLFFYLFGLSVLAFSFMISTIFSKARTGSFVGMILFFVMYFVSTGFSEQTAENTKTIGCLLSPVALSLGVQVVADLEATGQGVTFSNMGTLTTNFRFSTTLLFFAIDTVIYTVLGLYFEKVIPKDYGTTLKWYFPVSPSYWRGRRARHLTPWGVQGQAATADAVLVDVNGVAIEPVSTDFREQERSGEALMVQRMRKVFPVPGGEKIAVKGLDLTMYRDQITCLLGHNGAGKTTLISMLTGMIGPTSGTASFKGMSFTEDMDEIRESLGICFQHDVLFSEMTVEEHLILFACIKGYAKGEVAEIVSRQIREVGLTEKRHVQSAELSGGMKRKLSVAISLLGDSSLVFLDEPTSGMDPYSRRSTWEILLNNRNDRVMVLTTHFMDEADILGDRIAIMSEGELRCCGSSLFLKNRYGAGYNLTVVKDDKACIDNDVIQLIKSFVPNVNVLSNVGSEIAFQLPLESSYIFATMFSELDHRLDRLGVLSYGVSVTTLEEVFIKVAEAGDEDNQHTLNKNARHAAAADSSPYLLADDDRNGGDQRGTDGSMFSAHLHALLLKRFRIAKRDRKMLIFSTFLPILLLLAGLALLKGANLATSDPKIELTTAGFPLKEQTPTPFVCSADGGAWCSAMMKSGVYDGAQTEQIPSDSLSNLASSSPSAFGVQYSIPPGNKSTAMSYGLSLGLELYDRGFGKNDQSTVKDQTGAYLVHGDSSSNVLAYNIFVNSTATHGAPIFKALADQALYRFFASNASSGTSTNLNLKVNNHPLPLSASTAALISSIMSFSACLFIVIAFTFFPASIVVFLVKEKQSEHNAKHQQLVSGVSLGAFWMSNYLWDLLMYVVPCVAALVLIQVFDVSSLTGSGCSTCSSSTFPAVILLFVLFGLAICPFTYCLSYLFKEHASAQTYTIMANFIIGVVLMVVSFVLDQINSTKEVNKYLVFLWRLSPLFDLGNGLLRLTMNDITSIFSSDKEVKSPFSGDLMGFELIYLVFVSIVFGALAVGIDYAMTFPKIKNMAAGDHSVEEEQYEQDIDVAREAERVLSGAADEDAVVLKRIRKMYKGGKVAVRDLSFGLKRGDCFGFLGINGAGKTTTMKMLTGDVVPSSGSATLTGFDILTQQIEVRRQIGYCPQFDALFELLTVREHLELFARIKGISSAELENVVTGKIHQLNLAQFENKLAGSLSGGNKRKLSVAIALIGNPQIVFLDEPSTGMDPVSRRFMWDVIAGISTRSKASTIVLTTHSMEESEALCSRVGIMVGGRMRCLGSVQHLKNRFGDGMVFDVKMVTPDADELMGLAQELFGSFDGDRATFVTATDLESKCLAFGSVEYAKRITASHPTGYSLAAALERDGFMRAPAFCSWLVEERRFDALEEFLLSSFGDKNVTVMERQNDFARFKLRGTNEQLKLSMVFERIERVKTSMHIREYSVSQTTLEQIFNQFASEQAEEQDGRRRALNGQTQRSIVARLTRDRSKRQPRPSPPQPRESSRPSTTAWTQGAWRRARAWLSKSRRLLSCGTSASESMATDMPPPPLPPSTTSTRRLTRGALRRISAQEDASARVQEHEAFQSGLPTPKRRRGSSNVSESTTTNAENDNANEAENQAPPTNRRKMAVTTPSNATEMTAPSEPVASVVAVVTPPTKREEEQEAAKAARAVAVAEIALAQEEKKLEGAPEGALFVVTVLQSSEIEPAADVDAEVAAILEVLAAKAASADAKETDLSWAKEYAALDSVRRLAIHHHDRLADVLASGRVVADLVCPAAMYLRSAMVRNALLCIQDLIAATTQDGEKLYADIIPVLLQRTANEKQFIRDLAHDALVSCVETNPCEVLLTELLRISTTEKNAQIVSTAGVYTQKCLVKMDKARLKQFVLTTHDGFVDEMSAFLNCKVVECKAATRRSLQYLRRIIGVSELTTLVKTKLEGTAQVELLKASEEKKAAPVKSGLPKLSMRERMMQMKKQQAANGVASGAVATDDVVVLVPDATR